MDGSHIPYLPTGLWVLTAALTILILLVIFGFYIYWRKWAADIADTGSSVASLKATKVILERDTEALRTWMRDQKSELDRITVERQEQERLRAELADLEQQCALKNQENQTLRNEVGELENARHSLGQTLERLQREIGDLQSKRAEAQELDARLAELRLRAEQAQRVLGEIANLEVKLNSLSREKSELERTVEDLRTMAASARAAFHNLQQELNQTKLEFGRLSDQLGISRKERAELDVIIDTLRHEKDSLERAEQRLESKIEGLEASAKQAQEEANHFVNMARQASESFGRAQQELTALRREKERTSIELSELGARKAAIEQELSSLSKKGVGRNGDNETEDELAAYTDLLGKQPLCLQADSFIGKMENREETSLLLEVRNILRQDGLIFPARIIDAFHTSLKCHEINPITVLAGVSGTGKTLLPVRYAEIMGMHKLVMAVQPRWDSPQDMFGFYNYLEKEYKATELSRALVRMDPFNYPQKEFPMIQSRCFDRLLLVLVDEMNLARTEYYFSEFLSRLELRRAVKDPSIQTNRSEAEIELDAGPGKHRFRIWVDQNVFFVGTMNEDETTQTLSDKVLDRANVLRFGKPDENAKAVRNGNGEAKRISERYLSFAQWEKWKREPDPHADWYDQVSKWTVRINSALNRVGRPFGFRVLQAIGSYIANYPRVDDGTRYKLAFADQVEQKIIPKVRGIDLSTPNAHDCLNEIEAIMAELGDAELIEAFSSARTESGTIGTFQWRGVTRKGDEEETLQNAR